MSQDGAVGEPSDAEQAALRELYAVSPDDFLATRAELAARLTANGEQAAAQRLTRLRKPTIGAWIVNALVLDDPAVTAALTDLGADLRAAQDGLDADRLRDLSGHRRTLVAGLCTRAFALADRADPPAALRDDVRGTFDAAVADPDVALRLGRLQHAEQWSGFGFGATGAPQLTLVQGGRNDTGTAADKRSATDRTEARPTAAQQKQRRRALDTAQHAFDDADHEVDRAQGAVTDNQQRISRLEAELTSLRADLDDAKAKVASLRSALGAAKKQRQLTRRDLDRAQRRADE